jgi:hypothetical protein
MCLYAQYPHNKPSNDRALRALLEYSLNGQFGDKNNLQAKD